MPGGHRGLHEYLLDISHRGAHILQKWEGEEGGLSPGAGNTGPRSD